MEACARFELDRHGVMKKHLVPVACDKNCEGCGFNPAEQERRLKTGEFKPAHTRRAYDVENECWVENYPLPEGTKQLVFKSVKKEAEAVV